MFSIWYLCLSIYIFPLAHRKRNGNCSIVMNLNDRHSPSLIARITGVLVDEAGINGFEASIAGG